MDQYLRRNRVDRLGTQPIRFQGRSNGMQISFDIAGTPAEFRRKSSTGKAELLVGDEVVLLQDPLRVSTHFSFKTTQKWQCQVGEHVVEIVRVRPRFMGGARKNSYTITVDTNRVAAAAGL